MYTCISRYVTLPLENKLIVFPSELIIPLYVILRLTILQYKTRTHNFRINHLEPRIPGSINGARFARLPLSLPSKDPAVAIPRSRSPRLHAFPCGITIYKRTACTRKQLCESFDKENMFHRAERTQFNRTHTVRRVHT